jgi:probable rRNA maturation factor
MRLRLNVHYAVSRRTLPNESTLRRWARAALVGMRRKTVGLSVRIVGASEGKSFNQRYRRKRRPTNVLSFPYDAPAGLRTDILGDLVICAPVVQREAKALAVPAEAHWAHMLVHGIMHLRGYDHHTEEQALIMERREAQILKRLGFNDPYTPDRRLRLRS